MFLAFCAIREKISHCINLFHFDPFYVDVLGAIIAAKTSYSVLGLVG